MYYEALGNNIARACTHLRGLEGCRRASQQPPYHTTPRLIGEVDTTGDDAEGDRGGAGFIRMGEQGSKSTEMKPYTFWSFVCVGDDRIDL